MSYITFGWADHTDGAWKAKVYTFRGDKLINYKYIISSVLQCISFHKGKHSWCANLSSHVLKYLMLNIISGPLGNKISRNESKLFGLLLSQSLCRVVMLSNTNSTRTSKQDVDNWVNWFITDSVKEKTCKICSSSLLSPACITISPPQTQMCISHWVIFLLEQGVSHTNEVLFQLWLE